MKKTASEQLLIPARMLNQYAYCKRLGYLEWVQSEFVTNAEVIEGHLVHKVVDRDSGAWDVDADLKQKITSVKLSGPQQGLIAVIDMVEKDKDEAVIIEYKRGSVPDNPERSWEPDRIQVAAQALVLRENGLSCHEGILYYAASRTRIKIDINEELINKTLCTKQEFLDTVAQGVIPEPLENSNKCIGCSLAGICLPDEVTFLKEEKKFEKDKIRRLVPARDDALPMYVQLQGAYIGKQGEELVVKLKNDVIERVRLIDVSQLSLYGNVQVTTQALRELIYRNIPVSYYTYGGYFIGLTTGLSHKNVEIRIAQYKAYFETRLDFAKSIVVGKLRNSRRILMRNLKEEDKKTAGELSKYIKKASNAESFESLLGIEGMAAKIYFHGFSKLLNEETDFDISERNRRPPKDPVNALLSYTYGLLTKEYTVTLQAVGLDPFLGLYHTNKYGRPALALDLMEEMRSVIADSIVLSVINRKEINKDHFITSGNAVAMTDEGRKKLIEAYERRLDSLVNHPLFGYTISYRRIIEVQCRLFSRYLLGEIEEYFPFSVR